MSFLCLSFFPRCTRRLSLLSLSSRPFLCLPCRSLSSFPFCPVSFGPCLCVVRALLLLSRPHRSFVHGTRVSCRPRSVRGDRGEGESGPSETSTQLIQKDDPCLWESPSDKRLTPYFTPTSASRRVRYPAPRHLRDGWVLRGTLFLTQGSVQVPGLVGDSSFDLSPVGPYPTFYTRPGTTHTRRWSSAVPVRQSPCFGVVGQWTGHGLPPGPEIE